MLSLQELRNIARSRGGECLSPQYINNTTKLRWRCALGHEWAAIPQNVKRGHWCGICGNERQGRAKADSIEHMRQIALERKGICLSTKYKNGGIKLRWQCSKGHEWEAVPASVVDSRGRKGTWCPYCKGKLPKELAFKNLQALAISRGGFLVSTAYVNAKTKLRWRCTKGHEWEAVPDSVKRGTWCPICGGQKHRCEGYVYTALTDLREIARRYGGECLSAKYINTSNLMKWKCSEGHEWEARPDHVKEGHWCPICSAGISERICRALLEHITGVQFPKARPRWLINEKGNQMELDGFAPSLKLAFEYHGQQHFRIIPFFHQKKCLEKRRIDDEMKRHLCMKHGILLLEIHYDVPHGELQQYLIRRIEKTAPESNLIRNPSHIDIDKLGVRSVAKLEEMRALALSRGGVCLSNFYINSITKLRWRCTLGHEWEAIPSSVKKGTWCPICGDIRQGQKKAHTIEYMRTLAEAKGGQCLSNAYMNSKSRLRWKCAKGHEWETPASVIIGGHWCPKCEKWRLGRKYALKIEDVQKTAVQKGGECLSNIYLNSRTKLRWKCAKGHEWEAIANSVRRGTWCPFCAGKRR